MSAFSRVHMRGLFRRRSAVADDDVTDVSWRTLRSYARAASTFTAASPVLLPRHSFSRLSAMDVSGLPAHGTMAAADGCSLAFRHYTCNGDARAIVVLIHGAAGYGGQLHALARAIAATGKAQVYTLDMRGHGLSGGRPGHAVLYPAQMCDDIAEFLRFLDQRSPRARIILGGHSAGGGLVLRFCRSAAGRRLSGCLFLAPYLGLGSPTIRQLFGGWVSVRVNRLRAVTLANALGIRRFNDTTVVSFDLTACPNRQFYAPGWSFNTVLAMGPGLWAPDATPIAAQIPVLAVAGDRDECFFTDAYGAAFKTVAPHAALRIVGNCGHWDVLVDSAAIAVTTDWLAGVAGADNAGA